MAYVYAIFLAITADVSTSNCNCDDDINFVCGGPEGGLLTINVFHDSNS